MTIKLVMVSGCASIKITLCYSVIATINIYYLSTMLIKKKNKIITDK